MRGVDILIIYRIIKILVTDWDKQPAYYLGIIDSEGHVLRKAKELKTAKEKDAYSLLFRFVFNLKRLLALVPGGKSRLGSFAAALVLLLKEEDETELDANIMFEMNELEEDGMVGGIGGGGMSMGGASTNNIGSGAIALTWQPKKKKKLKKFIP